MMKKTEKAKGKERAAEKKKRTLWYAIAGVAACTVVAVVLYFALNPAVAKEGDNVSVSYVGMLENGSVFDSNVNRTPLSFTIGAHTVIPGFEDAVVGMKKDEVKTVHIPYDKAYGAYRSDLVYTVNRSQFSADTRPEAGMYYTVSSSSGTTSRVKIVNVTESTVTIDANHMLAGENLTFVIRLLTITQKK
jgi:peptidylprolyl isomerase